MTANKASSFPSLPPPSYFPSPYFNPLPTLSFSCNFFFLFCSLIGQSQPAIFVTRLIYLYHVAYVYFLCPREVILLAVCYLTNPYVCKYIKIFIEKKKIQYYCQGLSSCARATYSAVTVGGSYARFWSQCAYKPPILTAGGIEIQIIGSCALTVKHSQMYVTMVIRDNVCYHGYTGIMSHGGVTLQHALTIT